MRPPGFRLVAFAACAATVALAAAPAGSHQARDAHLHARFDRIAPATPGLAIEVRNQPPAPVLIVLRNNSGKPVEIAGTDGEPMVRVGPDGVSANRNSRSFHVSQDVTGEGGVPPFARPGAAPAWIKVSAQKEWRWYERRIQPAREPTDAERTSRTPVEVGRWSIPGTIAGSAFAIEGTVLWRPILGRIAARIVTIAPQPKELDLRVLAGSVPGMFLRNDTGKLLELTGRDGRPFARVGPAGVQVNDNSPTWRDTKGRPPPESIEPKWVNVQDTPILSWIERRAAYPADDPSDQVLASRRRLVLVRWTIEGTLGGGPFRVGGLTEWVPLGQTRAGDGGSSVPIAGVAVVVLAAAGAVAVLRRAARRRETIPAKPRRGRAP